MVKNLKMACYILMAAVTTAVAACAPSTMSKASSATAGSGADSLGAGEQRPGGRQQGITLESTVGESSLKQFQEGKSTKTPPSSPLRDIYFDFDRYDLTADARATLRANAEWLKHNPSTRVEIEGHCDERGTNEYNLALGAKRAQVARDFLATLGISPDRLSTISYGEELPLCKESNESCWRQNRRARFVIVQGRSTL